MGSHRFHKKQIVGAAAAIFLTFAAVLALYSQEFDIAVSEKAVLEERIKDYNFTTENEVTVVECQEAGKYLYVLYEQKEREGTGGLATLEKGILGNYRFLRCNNFIWPLYNVKTETIGRRNYLLVYGLNDLPEVEIYQVYDNFEKQGEPVYTGTVGEAPFLELIEMGEQIQTHSGCIRYLTADGGEITERELEERLSATGGGSSSSVGTAETGLLYAYVGIVLLLGIVVTRFFLMTEKTAAENSETEKRK